MERRKRVEIIFGVLVGVAIVIGIVLYIILKPSLSEGKFDYNYGLSDSVIKVGDRKEIEISESEFVFSYDVKNKEVLRIDSEAGKMYVIGMAEGESKIGIKAIGKNIVYENEVTITVIEEEKPTEPVTPPKEEEPEKPSEPTPEEPKLEEPVKPSTPEEPEEEYTEGEIGLRFEDCEFETIDDVLILQEDIDYFEVGSNFNIEEVRITIKIGDEEKELKPVFNNTYEIRDESEPYLLKATLLLNDGNKSFGFTKVFMVVRK